MEAASPSLNEALGAVARNVRLHAFAVWVMWSITFASLAGVVGVLLGRVGLYHMTVGTMVGIYVAALAYSAYRSATLPLDPFDLARFVDERLALKERVSSSFSFARGGEIDPTFHDLLARDASAVAEHMNAGKVLPNDRLIRMTAYALSAVLAFALTAWLCRYPVPAQGTAQTARIAQNLEHRLSAIERILPPHSAVAPVVRDAERQAHEAATLPPDKAREKLDKIVQQMDQQAAQHDVSDPSGGESSLPLPDRLRSLARELDRHAPKVDVPDKTSQRIDKIDKSLDSSGMRETKEHVENASKAERAGDPAKAAKELRLGANSAQRESADADGARRASQAAGDAARQMGTKGKGEQQGQSASASGSMTGQSPGGKSSSGGSGKLTTPNSSPGNGQEADVGHDAPMVSTPRRITGYDLSKSHGKDRIETTPGSDGRASDAGSQDAPRTNGGSTVPYGADNAAVRQRAESAIQRQVIPPAYRRAVESYFRPEAPAHP